VTLERTLGLGIDPRAFEFMHPSTGQIDASGLSHFENLANRASAKVLGQPAKKHIDLAA